MAIATFNTLTWANLATGHTVAKANIATLGTVAAPSASCTYPSFRSVAEAYATSGTSNTVNKPSGTVSGDVLVAIINVNANVTITAPADWVLIDEDDGIASTATVITYYKVAGGSEPSTYSWSWGTNSRNGCAIACFSGSFDSDPSNGTFSYSTQASSANTDVTVSAMTLTAGCAMVFYLGAYDQTAGATWGEPGSWVAATADDGTNNVYIGYNTFASSGSTGSVAYTCSSTNSYKVMWLWSIRRNDT